MFLQPILSLSSYKESDCNRLSNELSHHPYVLYTSIILIHIFFNVFCKVLQSCHDIVHKTIQFKLTLDTHKLPAFGLELTNMMEKSETCVDNSHNCDCLVSEWYELYGDETELFTRTWNFESDGISSNFSSVAEPSFSKFVIHVFIALFALAGRGESVVPLSSLLYSEHNRLFFQFDYAPLHFSSLNREIEKIVCDIER